MILGGFWEGRGENDKWKKLKPAPVASEDHHLAVEPMRGGTLSTNASSIGLIGFSEGPDYKKP